NPGPASPQDETLTTDYGPQGRPSIRATELRRARRALPERRLGGGEAGDRHPVRRTRHIVEPDLVAELNRGRVAAVFAADAELEVAARLASAFSGDPHKLADAVTVDRHERVGRKNS